MPLLARARTLDPIDRGELGRAARLLSGLEGAAASLAQMDELLL